MDLWKAISGMVYIELTSADVTSALQAINHEGIELFGLRMNGDLTAEFSIVRGDLPRLRKLSESRGDQVRLYKRQGLYWLAGRFLFRPVLMAGFMILVFLTFFLPGRILFVEVEGNIAVPSTLIAERAEACGITFGASRREVRSEKMKNALLAAVPQLQWAGINTYGCRAVISVKERSEPQEQETVDEVSSIIAASDGVIRQITLHRGNQLCKVGQAVRKGQVLISGYTDCGICIRATRAEGEVIAETERKISAVMPLEYAKKRQPLRQEKKYSLLIGKKQINFYKDSGIYDTTCDKMYSVKYITLPGGFQLPIAFVTQTLCYYTSEADVSEQEEAERIIERFSDYYTVDQMIAGQIERSQRVTDTDSGLLRMRTTYICVEMIGRTRPEESLDNYEAD